MHVDNFNSFINPLFSRNNNFTQINFVWVVFPDSISLGKVNIDDENTQSNGTGDFL